MGKYDDAMYRYLSDNGRFADLFNAVLFGGEKVLKAGMLAPDAERCTERGAKGGGNAFRDVRKRLDTGEGFAVVAVENQGIIDYAMPWRIMRYDQMEYGRQLEELRRVRRAEREALGLPRSRWTERPQKGDLLRPVYTICLYHGMEAWDGPRSLADMMGFPEGDVWRRCFHDYGMEIFCANEPIDYGKFGTELGLLFKTLPCRGDKEALLGLWESGEYSHLDYATVEAMAVMTDSPELMEKLEECEEGGYDMCLAVEEMRRDWKAEGKAEGIAEGKAEGKAQGLIEAGLDFGHSESDILELLRRKLDVSLEKAAEYFAAYGRRMA